MWEELPKSHFCAIFLLQRKKLLSVWLLWSNLVVIACVTVLVLHECAVPSSTGVQGPAVQTELGLERPLHSAAGLELGLHPTWTGLIAIKISLHCIPLSQGHQKLKAIPLWNHRDNLCLKLCWNKQGSSHSRAQGGSMCRPWWLWGSYLGSVRLFSFLLHLPGQFHVQSCILFPCEFPQRFYPGFPAFLCRGERWYYYFNWVFKTYV